jgi:pSer/pThr/pTyr-binding forkhead associated (FHA) protein
MSAGDRLDRTTASHSPAPSARGPRADSQAELVEAARGSLTQAGDYLVFSEGDLVRVVALIGDWTRIGRSTAADVRFDDPTVSRRHALIIREGAELKLVDDSSLNGIFVAGERIDRHTLVDGDSFLVGRYQMNFVSVTTDVAAEGAEPPSSLPV